VAKLNAKVLLMQSPVYGPVQDSKRDGDKIEMGCKSRFTFKRLRMG
jgi:hypothetical protein